MNFNNNSNSNNDKIFDVEPLLMDIKNVLNSGLTQLFKDFLLEHQLYKQTHLGVLNLINNNNLLNHRIIPENSISSHCNDIENKLNCKLESLIRLTNSSIHDLKQIVENNTMEISLLKNLIKGDLINKDLVEKENIILKMEPIEKKNSFKDIKIKVEKIEVKVNNPMYSFDESNNIIYEISDDEKEGSNLVLDKKLEEVEYK